MLAKKDMWQSMGGLKSGQPRFCAVVLKQNNLVLCFSRANLTPPGSGVVQASTATEAGRMHMAAPSTEGSSYNVSCGRVSLGTLDPSPFLSLTTRKVVSTILVKFKDILLSTDGE